MQQVRYNKRLFGENFFPTGILLMLYLGGIESFEMGETLAKIKCVAIFKKKCGGLVNGTLF